MTWTDAELTAIAQEVLAGAGYISINAVFEPTAEFKVHWNRTPERIRLHISDYLDDAPHDVLADIIKGAQARIDGIGSDHAPGTKTWLRSTIAETKGATYMERHYMHAGEHIDLESIRPEGCTAALRFGPMIWRDSGYSLLFNVIMISEELDNEGREEEIRALIMEEADSLAWAQDHF